jgi:hypothetical protein
MTNEPSGKYYDYTKDDETGAPLVGQNTIRASYIKQ